MRIISIKGTNIDLTDAIHDYVELKVDQLRKLCEEFDPADEIRVEVGKSTKHHSKGPYFRAEMHLHVPGKNIIASEEAEDLYAAIDKVKEQTKRQLKEHKDKLKQKSQKVKRPGK